MVVDDNADIRDSMRSVLEIEGYNVVVAENGAVALASLAGRQCPCLMLVDLLMPVMDGVELIEHLRRDPALSSIPVVIVSAAATVEPPAGTPILPKPLSVSTLLATVERYCAPTQPTAS
jgi:CheY-like chemotaxis protein